PEPLEVAGREDLLEHARGAAALGADPDAEPRELGELGDLVRALAEEEDRLGLREAGDHLEARLGGEGEARLDERGLDLAAPRGGGEALDVLERARARDVLDAAAPLRRG